MSCGYKHTKYQPTDEEWRCPKCGAGFEDKSGGFVIWDGVSDNEEGECQLLHVDDYLKCQKCGYDCQGKDFAAYVVKKNSLVSCPCCKGKGFVKNVSSVAGLSKGD